MHTGMATSSARGVEASSGIFKLVMLARLSIPVDIGLCHLRVVETVTVIPRMINDCSRDREVRLATVRVLQLAAVVLVLLTADAHTSSGEGGRVVCVSGGISCASDGRGSVWLSSRSSSQTTDARAQSGVNFSSTGIVSCWLAGEGASRFIEALILRELVRTIHVTRLSASVWVAVFEVGLKLPGFLFEVMGASAHVGPALVKWSVQAVQVVLLCVGT